MIGTRLNACDKTTEYHLVRMRVKTMRLLDV